MCALGFSVRQVGTVVSTFVAICLYESIVTSALAQVSSAMVGTQVVQQGNTFTITGGALSDQGTNLFHSFGQFNLSNEQAAHFQASPQVQNVFGQITGGQASVINGQLQLTGADANLYLINPAGILFGPNATLNLPASFTAVTATGIGFESGWLDLFGDQAYQGFNGPPVAFQFDETVSGTVINQGKLIVKEGQSISLLGNTVVNTGLLSAPGGSITVTAVEGSSQVRLSQAGHLLSLEGDAQTPLNPTALPNWLTGDNLSHAESLQIGSNGEIILSGADIPSTIVTPESGTVLLSGHVDVSSLDTPEENPSRLQSGPAQGGFVQILGETIALVQATIEASGLDGGGTVHLGGALQGQGTTPTASLTLIDRGSRIIADATTQGHGGEVIVWADLATQFLGEISAQGGLLGGDGGFVEVSGKQWLGFDGTVNVQSYLGEFGTLLLDPENIVIKEGFGTGTDDASLPRIDGADTTTPFIIYEETLEALAGSSNIELYATNNITIEDLNTEVVSPLWDGELTFANGSGTISFVADSDQDGVGAFTMVDVNDAIYAPGRDLSISGASITVGTLYTGRFSLGNNAGDGGSVTLSTLLSPGNGPITTGNIDTYSWALNNNANTGGRVTIAAATGAVTTGDIRTFSRAENNNTQNGGSVVLSTQQGDINTGNIRSYAQAAVNNSGSGGNISLATANGEIEAGHLNSSTQALNNLMSGDGGNISLGATDNVVVDYINAQSNGAAGGAITVIAGQQFRASDSFTATGGATASLSSIGDGGSGLISLQLGEAPFEVGDASSNGTQAAILAGDNAINQILPNQTITAAFAQGNFGISLPTVAATVQAPDVSGATITAIESLSNQITAQSNERTESSSISFSSVVLSDNRSTPVQQITQLENQFSQQFQKRLNLSGDYEVPLAMSLDQMSRTLQQVEARADLKAALVYIYFEGDNLEIILVTPQGQPVLRQVTDITQTEFQQLRVEFQQAVTNRVLSPAQYLPPAQALYDLMIRPIEADLESRKIQSLALILDEGMRSLPLAALHDGEKYLIESYSLGLLPTFSLTDFSQVATSQVTTASVLGMGIETFEEQVDLFAVPVELDLVTQGKGQSYLNDEFTRHNLEEQLKQQPTGIIHLATHAVFNPGAQDNSYIQLWDQKLTLDQLEQLPLSGASLLVLSACTTALGNPEAEYGFAGFAINAGAQTALASLWAVSDEGSLGFMTEFYRQLEYTSVRVEALRQAQLTMLRGELWMTDGTLYDEAGEQIAHLPQLANSGRWNFAHPAYWSAFTMIGNPW